MTQGRKSRLHSLKNRVRLRNRIVAFLNSQPELECKVHAGLVPGAVRERGRRESILGRLICGVGKGGRAIALYPFIYHREPIPKMIRDYLCNLEDRGGIAGTVRSVGDAWDVVVDNPSKWKRKQNTKLHRYHPGENSNGRKEHGTLGGGSEEGGGSEAQGG